MSQENQNCQSPGEEDVQLMRYYNDAQIAIDILYELAGAGSRGAKTSLQTVAEYASVRAVKWKIVSDIGKNDSQSDC